MSRGPDPFMMFEAPKIAPRLPAPSGSFNADPWNALSNDFLRSAKHRTMPGVKLATPEKMVMEFAGKPRPLPRISASAKRYFDNGWDDDAVDSDSDDGSAGGDGGEPVKEEPAKEEPAKEEPGGAETDTRASLVDKLLAASVAIIDYEGKNEKNKAT